MSPIGCGDGSTALTRLLAYYRERAVSHTRMETPPTPAGISVGPRLRPAYRYSALRGAAACLELLDKCGMLWRLNPVLQRGHDLPDIESEEG